VLLISILMLVIDTVAGMLAGVLLLRFWMQVMRVRPPVSISQFIYQLTDWLVLPFRRFLPGVGGYDWASLVGAFLVVMLVIVINLLVAQQFSPEIMLLLSVLRLMKWMLYGLMAILIIDVIFSWVNPHAPMAPFVRALNEPLMRPFRRLIPPIGNVDLTPLVVIILLQIVLQYLLPLIAVWLVGPQFLKLV